MSETTQASQLIREAIRRKLKDIPPLPQVVGELLNELQAEDTTTAAKLESLILRDPALATKTLRVVNSAYYGLSRKVLNIGQAVVILGTQQLRNLLLSLAAVSLLQGRSAKQRALQKAFWEHSLATGICADLILRRKGVPAKECDLAFVGGLLHEVGRLFLFTQLPDTYQKVADYALAHGEQLSDVETSTLGISHDEVGIELARLWQFPEALEQFVSGHDGPFDEFSSQALLAVHAAHIQVESIFKVSMDAGKVDPFVETWLEFGDFDWIALRNETAKRIDGQFDMLTQVAA